MSVTCPSPRSPRQNTDALLYSTCNAPYLSFVAFINALHTERLEYQSRGLGHEFYDQYHFTLDTHVRLRGLAHYDELFRGSGLPDSAHTSLPPLLDHTIHADVREACRVDDPAKPPAAPPAPDSAPPATRSQKLRAKSSKKPGKRGKK